MRMLEAVVSLAAAVALAIMSCEVASLRKDVAVMRFELSECKAASEIMVDYLKGTPKPDDYFTISDLSDDGESTEWLVECRFSKYEDSVRFLERCVK